MLHHIFFLLFLSFISPLIAICQTGSSKWEMVGFIGFTSIARQSSTTVVATTSHGYLYFSNDNGNTWKRRELDDTLALTDIAFLDSLHVVVTDQANHIMFSSDGGITWRYSHLSIPFPDIRSVAYPAKDTIYVGDFLGNIWRTIDEGKSDWKLQTSTTGKTINKLLFQNARNGFAAGDNGSFFKTTDAGEHWSQQDIIQGDTNNLYTIEFYGANTGIIGGDGHYYTTLDAGINWKIHVMPMAIRAPLYIIKLLNETEFFALGFSGQVYNSSNFGDTLGAKLLDHIAQIDYTRSAIYDQKHGAIAVGDRALIMTSPDGKEWIPKNQCPARGPMESLGNGIIHNGTTLPVLSTDGGIFWNGFYYQNELDFIGLHFTSRDSGFLINSFNHDWFRTSDNGKTWITPVFSPLFPIPSVQSGGFGPYSFFGRNTGYVAGDTIIVHTSDNGVTWNTVLISYDRSTPFNGLGKPKYWGISSIQAVDHLLGFAVLGITDSIFHPTGGQSKLGNYHTQLFKTTNGGISWNIMANAPALPQMHQIRFINNNLGFIACDSSVIYKTIDGGNTWVRYRFTTAQNNFIKGFRFLNDSIGFISYRYDGFFSTTDGGKTWTKENPRHPSVYPDPMTIYDFIFPDSNTVLAIAEGSTGAGFFRKTLNLNHASVQLDFSGNPQQYMYIRTYPNPTTGIFHCQLDGLYVDPSGNLIATMYDMLGRQVMDLTSLARNNNNGVTSLFTVDASKLPAGVYTIKYQLGSLSYAKQLVITH